MAEGPTSATMRAQRIVVTYLSAELNQENKSHGRLIYYSFVKLQQTLHFFFFMSKSLILFSFPTFLSPFVYVFSEGYVVATISVCV